MQTRIWPILPLFLAALAGCADGDVLDPAGSVECPECIDAEGAAIRGRVTDESGLPVDGALVGIQETGTQVATDGSGRFVFAGLEPGAYTVAVVKIGYESVAKRVEVGDAPVDIVIEVAVIAIVEPYVETIGPEEGFFSCAVGTPGVIRTCSALAPSVFTQDKTTLPFHMSSEHWETFVGEMRWQQGTFATSTHLANFLSYEGREGTHWWCAADGEAPIVFRYERERDSVCSDQGDTDPEPSPEMTLTVAADSGFGGLSADNPPVRVALQQRYELLVSIFYGEPAPEGFSGFPDI